MQQGRNITLEKKHKLLDLIFLYRNIIESKKTNKVSKLEKEKAWTNITQKFNQDKTVVWSQHNLHLCWDNIKRNAKKYFAAIKRKYYKTGINLLKL